MIALTVIAGFLGVLLSLGFFAWRGSPARWIVWLPIALAGWVPFVYLLIRVLSGDIPRDVDDGA